MTDADLRRFQMIAADVLGLDEEQVTPAATFDGDLGADSLDLVELVMALEAEFGVTIDEDELEGIETVEQAYGLIRSKLVDDASPVAVITGGARGIGAATAIRLVHRGWRVAILDVCQNDPALAYELASSEDLDATVAACKSQTTGEGDAFGVVADVRDQQQLDDAIATVLGRWGRVDVAIAAAGAIVGGDDAWDTSDEQWEAMLDINLTGVWRLARVTVPHLLRGGEGHAGKRGRFIAVASAAAVTGLPKLAAYTAAKHGVAGLIKALAAELGPHGVAVNAVSPGSTATAMLDASAAVYDRASPDEFIEHQPIGRLIDPGEIADTIVWLAADAPSAMTGSILPVDGGMTAT